MGFFWKPMGGFPFQEGGLASGYVKVVGGQSAIWHRKGNNMLRESEA